MGSVVRKSEGGKATEQDLEGRPRCVSHRHHLHGSLECWCVGGVGWALGLYEFPWLL